MTIIIWGKKKHSFKRNFYLKNSHNHFQYTFNSQRVQALIRALKQKLSDLGLKYACNSVLPYIYKENKFVIYVCL